MKHEWATERITGLDLARSSGDRPPDRRVSLLAYTQRPQGRGCSQLHRLVQMRVMGHPAGAENTRLSPKEQAGHAPGGSVE